MTMPLRIKLSRHCGVMTMIETFIHSFKLRNAYKTNTIIYSLKSIPLVKRLLPDSLYASRTLKTFANVISFLLELCSIFLGKLIYILLMVFLSVSLMKSTAENTFVHVFFFLTIAGGFLNTHIFNPTKDKYYAMFLMRMDAKEYTLTNYYYFLLKIIVGFLPFTLIFGHLAGVSILSCAAMPFFVCGVKLIITAYTLHDSREGENVKNENLPTAVVWIGVAAAIIAAYAPPFFGYAMNEAVFLGISVAVMAGGIFCLVYIMHFQEYRAVYRVLLTPQNFAMNQSTSMQAVKDNYKKKITADLSQTSSQSGYKYFNELFMKRHSKMLTRTAVKITCVSLIILCAAVFACLTVPDIRMRINGMMLTFLPYFLFIMYLINRGRGITMALFMNCDQSMLTYRFYRQPQAIIALFAERLKYITRINLMPASVIAVGLPLLLYISGGTDNWVNYVVLFVSILAMSVFFSVHTLVMYYLLQPYNVAMESKSALYGIVNYITYIVCYIAIGKKVPTIFFGIAVSLFCVLYTAAALILAYRLAPKTFKLRQ